MSTKGRGALVLRVNRSSPISRPSVLHSYQGGSKSAPLRRCPIDARPVPDGFGRPRTYCTDDCRREAANRRHELDAMTAELAHARDQLAAGASASYWRGRIARLECEVSDQRARTPDALRP